MEMFHVLIVLIKIAHNVLGMLRTAQHVQGDRDQILIGLASFALKISVWNAHIINRNVKSVKMDIINKLIFALYVQDNVKPVTLI